MKTPKQKITSLSRLLKITFLIAACALPLLDAGFWITNGYPFLKPFFSWDIIPQFDNQAQITPDQLSPLIKFLGFLLSLVPTSIYVIALAFLVKLFKHFENFEIFTEESVKCIRKLGFCILLNQLLYPVYIALYSLTLTITNPPGQRMIAVAFGGQQLSLLVIGCTIILISWIMEEGCKLKEDQAATI